MSVLKDVLRSLTDAFAKGEDSNNGKLLKIFSEQIDTLNTGLNRIETWRGIDKAEGVALAEIAVNFGQKRGKTDDQMLRVLIKARIARNYSDGTIDKMIQALALSINAKPDTIKIRSLYNDGEPAALEITGIPFSALNAVGMTVNQFGFIAQQVAAAGVRVSQVNIEGTFSFSSQADTIETDATIGFAPLDQSSGGELGAVFDPTTDTALPF